MSTGESRERLKGALKRHHQVLEELESALMEFEEDLEGRAPQRPQSAVGSADFELLSIPEVCQRLGMGKSWVYRRIHNQEIPSVRLGRTIKIKRSDLEQYLEEHRNRPAGGAQL